MIDSTNEQRRATPSTSSETRTALLAAGRDCVRTHGLAKTTSRLIADTAGANLAAITYYFGSKDHLLAESLFGELEHRLSPVLDQLESEAPATNRLLEAVQHLIAEFERAPADVRVYLSALVASTEPGPLADRANSLLADLTNRLAVTIGQLKIDAVIAPWVDPGPMASLLVASANGIALQTQLLPGHSTVVDMAGQLTGLLLSAASPQPESGAISGE